MTYQRVTRQAAVAIHASSHSLGSINAIVRPPRELISGRGGKGYGGLQATRRDEEGPLRDLVSLARVLYTTLRAGWQRAQRVTGSLRA